jgi:DNA-binding protein H-NS
MAINLGSLSPTELRALIKNAEAQMESARKSQIHDVRSKIDAALKSSGLTLAEVYPTRGGKAAKGPKAAVAPKYRNPENTSQTWSGRGKRPLWFVKALKKRGVTAENLLIAGTPKSATTKVAKKAPVKAAKKATAKKAKA